MEKAIEHMAVQALRTIGLCYKEVDISQIDTEKTDHRGIFDYEKSGFTMIGLCGIKDIIRPDVPVSIKICNRAGISVKMVTGDNKITAEAIAKEIQLINEDNKDTAIVMEGPEFLRLIGGIICAHHRENPDSCDCVNNE